MKKVKLKPSNSVISSEYIDEILQFLWHNSNLNELQNKIEIIKKRYESEGYSLARVKGPDRISENG